MTTNSKRIEINGSPATVTDLATLVQTNYGHFTAMQMREGAVRGLDLHLRRLDQASRQLYDTPLDPGRLRDYLRHIVAGDPQPLSIRINVFSRALDRNDLRAAVPVDVLIIAAAPASPSMTPLRLKSFRYTRELAAVKHVGTFPLFHFRRLAQQAGFDDAVFVDESGRLAEGSIWNIGFASRNEILWPDAPQLPGVSLQLLQTGLQHLGVRSSTRSIFVCELADLRSAFFSNASQPVRPIASIDHVQFRIDEALIATLIQAYESNPWEVV